MSLVCLPSNDTGALPYASLSTIKAQLGITDAAQDASLTALLTQASALVDTYCGRQLGYATYSETFRLAPFDSRFALLLSRLPVVNVSGLIIDGTDFAQIVDTLDWDAAAGLLYPFPGVGVWGSSLGCGSTTRITVIYDAGYVVDGMDVPDPDSGDGATLPVTLPPEIALATLATARALYHAPGRGDPMIRSESAQGVGSVSYLDPDTATGGLPPDAAAALAGYRRIGLA